MIYLLLAIQLYQVFYYQSKDLFYIKSDDPRQYTGQVNAVLYDAWDHTAYRTNVPIELNEFTFINTKDVSAFVLAIGNQKFSYNKNKSPMNITYENEIYNGQEILVFNISFKVKQQNVTYSIYKQNKLIFEETINVDYKLSYKFQLPKIFDKIIITQTVDSIQETPAYNFSNRIIIDEQILQFQEIIPPEYLRQQTLILGSDAYNFPIQKLIKTSEGQTHSDGYCTISNDIFTDFFVNGGDESTLCNMGSIPIFDIYAHKSIVNTKITDQQTLIEYLNTQYNRFISPDDFIKLKYEDLQIIDHNLILYAEQQYFTIGQIIANNSKWTFNNFTYDFSKFISQQNTPSMFLELKINGQLTINYLYLLLQQDKTLNITNNLTYECDKCIAIKDRICSKVIFDIGGVTCNDELIENTANNKINISIYDIIFLVNINVQEYKLDLITPKIQYLTNNKNILSTNYIIFLVVEAILFIVINIVAGVLYVKGKKHIYDIKTKQVSKSKTKKFKQIKTEFSHINLKTKPSKTQVSRPQSCYEKSISFITLQAGLNNEMVLSQQSTIHYSLSMLQSQKVNINMQQESILNMCGPEDSIEPPVTSVSVHITDVSVYNSLSLQCSQTISHSPAGLSGQNTEGASQTANSVKL